MGTPVEEFGPYAVYEQLGLGGMATVHRAETQGIAGFSKQVALKRMLPNVAANASLVKSFIREARLASHLRHENVAQTYDLGKVGQTYFIAMELVPGRNLREILKHCAAVVGHMPLPIVLNIVSQICDALDYAHNLCDETGQPLGIIHRDVSPANIIVNDGGVVKLIDFGIAKASSAAGNMNTMSGTIKGKFSYMAPEYLMGSIDSRADLFALGVIAHELLANRPLFQGKDDMDTLYRVKDMPILPPSRINPQVPAELDSIVMTALDRNPDQRWQRANAFRQALATEIKRLNLHAHNAQVIEWIDKAFTQQKKATFQEDSEPLISISSGTTELGRGATPGGVAGSAPRRTPRREVPDDFSNADAMATLVTPAALKGLPPVKARTDDWNVATEMTTPMSDAMDRPVGGRADSEWQKTTDPTKQVRKSAPIAATDPNLVDTRRDRSGPVARTSSPNVVRRNTPVPRDEFDADEIRTQRPGAERRELLGTKRDDDDDAQTLPPDADRRSFERPSAPRIASPVARPRPSEPPPRGASPGTAGARSDADAARRSIDRPSQPALAPRSDAQARTIMIDAGRTERPSQPMPLGGPAKPMPLGGPAQPMPLGGPFDSPPPSARPGKPDFAISSAPAPQQRTMIAEPSAPDPRASYPPSGLAAKGAPLVRTLPGAGAPGGGTPGGALTSDPYSPASSGARTTPRMSGADVADAAGSVDNLGARGVRPSAAQIGRQNQGSVAQTKVEPTRRSGASNFLLAVLVLIAAGGAAAVVYFALPYLT